MNETDNEKKYSPEGIFATLLFIVLILIVLTQVFTRAGLFPPPVWTEELARWIWVWMAWFGISEAERTNSQLKMTFIVDTLPQYTRSILFTVIDVVYLGIMVHLSYIGYKTFLRTLYNESVTLPVSDGALYLSAFLASFLIIGRIALRLKKQIDTLKKNKQEASS